MKTPEEIKKGLECCSKTDKCPECPYSGEDYCAIKKDVDALAYIQRLEEQNAELVRKTEQLQRELDAAVADLNCNWKCAICKRFTKPINKCPHYGECGLGYRFFEWRGVPKEENTNG